MKLISWNVNGIRACVQKGFLDFFKEADADIFCIQETKMQEGQLTLDLPGYHQYWNYAVRKGYSGHAFLMVGGTTSAVQSMLLMVSGSRNMIRKGVSSHASLKTFTLSQYILRTRRMSWRGWITA